MLTQEEICRALHASRGVPLAGANPHGPLGLEQLADAVAADREHTQRTLSQPRENGIGLETSLQFAHCSKI
jgi:hypothetical protein